MIQDFPETIRLCILSYLEDPRPVMNACSCLRAWVHIFSHLPRFITKSLGRQILNPSIRVTWALSQALPMAQISTFGRAYDALARARMLEDDQTLERLLEALKQPQVADRAALSSSDDGITDDFPKVSSSITSTVQHNHSPSMSFLLEELLAEQGHIDALKAAFDHGLLHTNKLVQLLWGAGHHTVTVEFIQWMAEQPEGLPEKLRLSPPILAELDDCTLLRLLSSQYVDPKSLVQAHPRLLVCQPDLLKMYPAVLPILLKSAVIKNQLNLISLILDLGLLASEKEGAKWKEPAQELAKKLGHSKAYKLLKGGSSRSAVKRFPWVF